MRALAWWRATPEPIETAKDKAKPDRKPKLSRIRQAEERGQDVYLPDVEADALYLVDALLEAGPTSVAGPGFIPLTWVDLQAWSKGTSTELAPWEARVVRQLSAEWLAEFERAKKAAAAPPWEGNDEGANLVRVANDMQARIEALAKL